MSLLITSTSNLHYSEDSEKNKNKKSGKNQENEKITNKKTEQNQETIKKNKQIELNILQAINSSNDDENEEQQTQEHPSNIAHFQKNQPRATTKTTKGRNTNENPTNNTKENQDKMQATNSQQEPEDNQGPNQETHNNPRIAKNIEDWNELFRKAREKLPAPTNKQSDQRTEKIQPTIMPISGNSEFGDSINSNPKTNNFRLYFQNVNGLAVGKGTRKWEDIINEMKTRKVSVCGFAETNVEWQAKNTKARLKSKLRHIAGKSTMTTSTTSLKFKSTYKPGGTTTIALNDWAGRVIQTVKDPSGQGRWSGFQMRTKNHNIVIVTAYRVPQQSIDQVGYKTTYAQQWVVERLKGTETPEPRKQCIKDLTKQIQEWQKEKLDVIIMIDANEQMGTEDEGISSLAATCNLTDIHAHHHQGINDIATYARGTKRIDFILLSKNLIEKTTASGFLAFYDGIETDHRGSFVDFDADMLFKDKTPVLHTQAQRNLKSKKPQAVKQYKTELWKRLKNHNIEERSIKIRTQASQSPLPADFEKELNSIANTIQEAMLQAEKTCTKCPIATYSKKLSDLNLTIKYWKTVKSGKKTGKNVSAQLNAMRQKVDKESKIKMIKQFNIGKHIRISLKEYNDAIPNAKELRHSQLMESAMAAAKTGNKSAEQHYKSMAHAENSRETFRILRNIVKPEDRSGIRQIDIPQRDASGKIQQTTQGTDKMITISDPQEVEQAIIRRNIKHFGQADGTPFTSQALIDIFGRDGDSKATEELLQGKLPKIDHLPEAVQRILKKISENPCTEPIDTEVTTQELKNLFKKWKERTSTSPSGCHLGHWHALQAPDGDDPSAEDYEELGDNIMSIHANIMNAATLSGTPLERWKQVDSTMLAKSTGKPRIDKLRVIHLYEADYNGFLKTVWPHRAVRHATKRKRLNYAQGGGQKGRQANHTVLQKEMKYVHARLRKHNFATMDNDAKACYDRIIMLLATIISGHFGIPKNARDLQAKTIRNMQFRIRTALGISATHYEDTIETPLHGSGQGSGSSATIWMFISSIILDCFEEVAEGMTIANMDKTNEITQWIDGYVDDTSIFTSITETNDREPIKPTDLAEQLQKNTQEWEILLAATGGKLELTKCFYYILCWKFDEEGKPRPTTKAELDQDGVSISIQESGEASKTIIQHLDCSTAHKTLGLQKTPIGNQDEQLQKIHEKSNNIAQAIATSSITRDQAKTAWTSMYIPAIAYPLVATYFQENDLNKVENKALTAFLPKMGYNRHMPRAVVYGPEECGGMGIKNLYVEQSVEQIKAYMQHTRLDSPLGRIMSINKDWVQLIAGIEKPIFEDTKRLHHLEGEWYISIREFLHSTSCQIKTIDGWLPQLERENDKCIMDVLEGTTKETSEKINRCRIFLQATTLADITGPEGTHITKFAWGETSNTAVSPRESKHEWPRQPRPGPRSWYAWRSALKQYLSADGKSPKLRQDLGKWTVSPSKSRQQWEWYHDQRTNSLLHQTNNSIEVHAHRKGRSYKKRSRETIKKIPKSAIPVSVDHHTIQARTRTYIPRQQIHSKQPTTFLEYIARLDPWEAKLLKTNNKTKIQKLIQSITTQEKIDIVSDGGEKNGYGSFGWVIAGEEEYARGRGEAEGAQHLMQSFRAESYGMLAALRFLQRTCQWHDKWPSTNKTITTFSDNLSLIQRIQWHKKRIVLTPKNVSAPDYDTEKAITSTIDFLETKKIFIKVQHVKGHQDRKRNKANLSKESSMNVEADKEATIALELHSNKQEYCELPETRAMLYKHGEPVTSNEAITLRRAYLSQDLLQHMQNREKWKNANTADKISWIAHHRALRRMTSVDKTRLHKFIHRWLPTNKKLNVIDKEHCSKCPSCNETETNDHVTECNNPRRRQVRNKIKTNLAKILDKYHTCLQIKECILIGVTKAWNGDMNPIQHQDLSFALQGNVKQALEDQQEVGWTNFYRGRIALEWQTAQQEHYTKQFNKYQDTDKWTTAIITTLWHGFLQLWESRKDDQHGRDQQEKQEKERDILLRRTRALYEQLGKFDYEDTRYFTKQVQYWEQAPNHVIEEWLDMAERIAKKYKHITIANLRRNRIEKNQPLITGFFGGIRDETPQVRHGKTYNRRPPRKPPHGG
jgi:hypothetical protein